MEDTNKIDQEVEVRKEEEATPTKEMVDGTPIIREEIGSLIRMKITLGIKITIILGVVKKKRMMKLRTIDY